MKDISNVSIEICIEANNETAARELAATYGMNSTHSPWYRNQSGEGGRLYLTKCSRESRDIDEVMRHVIGGRPIDAVDSIRHRSSNR
jgi:hypothetical protein